MRVWELNSLAFKQREYFYRGKTRPLKVRLAHLRRLYEGILAYEQQIYDALKSDLNKSEYDAYVTEIGYTLKEISQTIKQLPKWDKPKKVRKAPIYLFGTKSWIINEPYGVVLNIAPWNYPFQLAIIPLVGAIASGNTVILKPSELTPETSKLLAKMLRELFPEELVAVVEGGKEISELLLEVNFDYVFFTGGTEIGRSVAVAAAKKLTPVTLELGGKSPVIVHRDANVALAARRVAFGKFLNAGQTCVAPDYVYVYQSVAGEFLDALAQEIEKLYGKEPLNNPNYTRIVNQAHFERLTAFLETDKDKIEIGGGVDAEKLLIEPTIIHDVWWRNPVMKEEIFGPILPIVEYLNLDVVLEEIIEQPKPLALYLFTESKKIQKDVLSKVSFGGGCINDTLFHLTHPQLPFGGVGDSGMGRYHGKYSFETFTHQKSIVKQTTKFDLSMRYDSSDKALSWVKKVMK